METKEDNIYLGSKGYDSGYIYLPYILSEIQPTFIDIEKQKMEVIQKNRESLIDWLLENKECELLPIPSPNIEPISTRYASKIINNSYYGII